MFQPDNDYKTPESVGVPTHEENLVEVERLMTEYLADNPDLLTQESLLGDTDPSQFGAKALLDELQPQAQHTYESLVKGVGDSDDPYTTYAALHDMTVEEVMRVVHLAGSIDCFLNHWNEAALQKTDDAFTASIPVDHPLHIARKKAEAQRSAMESGNLGAMLGALLGHQPQPDRVQEYLADESSPTPSDFPGWDLDADPDTIPPDERL